MAAPCAHVCVRGPVRKYSRGRPFNGIVRRHKIMELTKFEAATRQLNTAIQLFFEQRDPVSVRTLVGAASRVFADLVEHRNPGKSWRGNIVASIPQLSPREVYRIIDKTQNFLKHADEDPEGVELFSEEENDGLLFVSCLECGEIGETSYEMQAFQIWYMAAYPESFGPANSPAADALNLLPKLHALGRVEKIAEGARFFATHRTASEVLSAV